MKIKVYVIDFEAPRWLRRLLAYGLPVVAVLGAGALAYASGVPKAWINSEMLTASDLNGNFTAVTTVKNGGVIYSVGATKYCGESATPQNGLFSYSGLTGYAAAKAACAAAGGACTSTAHMCTSEELVRTAALGLAGPSASGWFAGFFLAMSQTAGTTAVAQLVTDCSGWTYAASNQSGPATGGAAGPYNAITLPCNQPQPILCCD